MITEDDIAWLEKTLSRYPGIGDRKERIIAALKSQIRIIPLMFKEETYRYYPNIVGHVRNDKSIFIEAILKDCRVLKFDPPLELPIEHINEFYELNEFTLTINLADTSIDGLMDLFVASIFSDWEDYAMEDDSKLTKYALVLKQNLLNRITEIKKQNFQEGSSFFDTDDYDNSDYVDDLTDRD